MTNDRELHETLEQMERMYRALAALHRDVYPINPNQFALLAEGPHAELDQLQQQIDVYTGRSELTDLLSLT